MKTNIPDPPLKFPAGFAAPIYSAIDKGLNIHEYLINHPEATFFMRVKSDSMIQRGIEKNDILVVDRSLIPLNNQIIVAALNGELLIRRVSFQNKEIKLIPENPDFPTFKISKSDDFFVWGVVTSAIKRL